MRWEYVRSVLALLICVAMPLAARAAQVGGAGTERVVVPRLSAAPPMDGTLAGTWAEAATVPLTHEGTYRGAASDATTVRVGLFGKSLFVAFVAVQRAGLVANQHVDGPGVLTDDAVMVHLWPDGLQGFAYWFATNPNGARDQYSSENSAFSPTWVAAAKRTADGYVASLQIPLPALHAKSAQNWLAQFHRIVVADRANLVWELEPEQSNFIDARYGGTLIGLETQGAPAQPRLQVYGLDAVASKAAGGTTSRLGADFSVPITSTTSFFGTAHPDFSDVEIDQQSIAPTVFARRFQEVRPFFTQAANAFNAFSGVNTPMTPLYTPLIPTFRGGFGVEGTQRLEAGTLSVSAFDALGYRRSDNAQVVSFSNPSQTLAINFERVGVHVPAASLADLVQMGGLTYFNPHGHLTLFANEAVESGSTIARGADARYRDVGATYATNTTQLSFTLQKLGAQFNPVDGFVNEAPGDPGLAGYTVLARRQINYSPTSAVQDVIGLVQVDRYHGGSGAVSQSDFADQLQVDFKNLMTLRLFQGVSGLSVCQPVTPSTCTTGFLPFNGSGVLLGYAQNTARPSSVTYTTGAYYHGRLASWLRSATVPLTARTSLVLEADDTAYVSGTRGEQNTKQWLERWSLNYQVNRSLSLALGVRRIVGTNPPFAYAPLGPVRAFSPAVCAGSVNVFGPPVSGCSVYDDASNVSAALHFFRGQNELYIAYGNPNTLTTTPALYVKLIRYVGAGKGS